MFTKHMWFTWLYIFNDLWCTGMLNISHWSCFALKPVRQVFFPSRQRAIRESLLAFLPLLSLAPLFFYSSRYIAHFNSTRCNMYQTGRILISHRKDSIISHETFVFVLSTACCNFFSSSSSSKSPIVCAKFFSHQISLDVIVLPRDNSRRLHVTLIAKKNHCCVDSNQKSQDFIKISSRCDVVISDTCKLITYHLDNVKRNFRSIFVEIELIEIIRLLSIAAFTSVESSLLNERDQYARVLIYIDERALFRSSKPRKTGCEVFKRLAALFICTINKLSSPSIGALQSKVLHRVRAILEK
jgi:hypothetical protein